MTAKSQEELDELVRRMKAEKASHENYRERSLKLHGWICAKCGREFDQHNLQLLTVHHRDGNHQNNPPTEATGRTSASTATTPSTRRGCSATT